jgi:hypothetical protein
VSKRITNSAMAGYSSQSGAIGYVYDGVGDIPVASFTAGTQSAAMESVGPTNNDGYMHWTADAGI